MRETVGGAGRQLVGVGRGPTRGAAFINILAFITWRLTGRRVGVAARRTRRLARERARDELLFQS